MSGVAIVYALFASREEAEEIARAMVERRLAACVNLLAPCRSVYRWQGRIEESEEIPAIFKTASASAPALIEAIAAMHSYDVPAISSWPADSVWPPYAQWVSAETAD